MNTVVNYSISIGLGVAGTVESRIDRTGDQVLRGYRSAWYVGIGLAGSGVLISFIFALVSEHKARRQPVVVDSEQTDVDSVSASA